MKRIDLKGKKFGRLTVLKCIGKTKNHVLIWECLCDCGKKHNVFGRDIKSGNTKSCGCYQREAFIKRFTIHGRSKTIEHNLWWSMIQRCYDKNSSGYYKYGERGIKVCNRWRNSFLNFFHDMGKRPSKKYSIERVDNNGDYKPSNCKWGTYTEQARNQRIRKDNVSGKRGVSWYKSYSKWVVHIGLNYKLIHIGYFDNLKDAILAREKAEDDYWGI